MLGLDREADRWLAGVGLAHSVGFGDFALAGADAAGEMRSQLTSVHPYGRFAVNERLSVWGVLGYGAAA